MNHKSISKSLPNNHPYIKNESSNKSSHNIFQSNSNSNSNLILPQFFNNNTKPSIWYIQTNKIEIVGKLYLKNLLIINHKKTILKTIKQR